MQAFHGDSKIKARYLKRVRAHFKADEIIKGKYWQGGKGCAVGCTIHSSQHSAYETELGIPKWLARLEDRIFEGLPNKRAKLFPEQFLKAVNVGADLNKIKIPMLIFIVESARENTKNKKYLKTIDGVLTELRRDILDLDKLRKARADAAYAAYAAYAAAAADAAAYAADAAAYAADAAADAAAYAADAAAYAAADAAAYAADAAYAAAYAAARKKIYVKFAGKLLELMKDCK